MDLKIVRQKYLSCGIFSKLFDMNNNLIAITLEHAYQINNIWVPKIPNGKFLCVKGIHRLANMIKGFETFEITGVSGHTNLLFHCGNFNRDSEGCILLGVKTLMIPDTNNLMIVSSHVAFNKFIDLQSNVKQFYLTVEGKDASVV